MCDRERAAAYRAKKRAGAPFRPTGEWMRRPWSEYLAEGYVRVTLPADSGTLYPTVRQNGSKNSWAILRSHLVWNQAHPDDLVLPGEEVHHIDGVRTNDAPENLSKKTKSEHTFLHAEERRRILQLERELEEMRRACLYRISQIVPAWT